jgi:glycosyltransferase involved in cell wall biosynthesis
MNFEQQILLLKKSPELHSSWYQTQYPDTLLLGLSSAEHYLRFGALLGRNPGKHFDTKYYLETYSDVAISGMNPLVHYILYGEKEGRNKNPMQEKMAFAKRDKNDLIKEDIQNRIVKHLWGGHSIQALESLEILYSDTENPLNIRFLAASNAACWYYFVEDYKKSLALAELISSLEANYNNTKIVTMIYAYSYMALDQYSSAQKVLHNYLKYNAEDSDIRLALSNTFKDDNLRLEHINQVYTCQGLSPIEHINTQLPLSLSNITAKPTPVHSTLKVSIIIPTYNSADKLGIAIESLLAQSWQNIEIIVVDDCSTDDTYSVAKSYSKKDSRVIAIRQQKNGGAYIARNTGLQYITGSFVTTHDGDDWSHPQKIEKQMIFLQENPDVMGVCTYWIRAENSLHFRHDWRLNSHLIHWSHSSFIFRRRVIEEIGSWDKVIVGGDTEFIWRVQAKYGKSSVRQILPKIPLAIALDDQGSLTRSKATHVKTIHYGLRHIYRSNAQHWHQKYQLIALKETNKRPFPAPLSMLTREKATIVSDTLIVADYSILSICERILEIAKGLHNEGKTLALYHWPFFESPNAPLSPLYFEILENFQAKPIVHGEELTCEFTIVADYRILRYIPDQLPAVKTKNGKIIIDSTIDQNFLQEISDNFFKAYKAHPKLTNLNILEYDR